MKGKFITLEGPDGSGKTTISKIVYDISKFAYENRKEDYAYYRRITRFDFTDFNRIYDNEILRIVGRIMKKF